MQTTRILMYILMGIGGIALISIIFQLFKIRVWISVKRGGKFVNIGFLDSKDQYEVPEVHLADNVKAQPIGRVKMGEKDDNAYAEVLLTDPDDESAKPQYRTCGYITQEGLIYKIADKRKKPELIGYTARPSKPDEPTIFGERTWKTMWLKSSLNAYLGTPGKWQENETAASAKPNTNSKINSRQIILNSEEPGEKPEESKETQELTPLDEPTEKTVHPTEEEKKNKKEEKKEEKKEGKKEDKKKGKKKDKRKKKAAIKIPNTKAFYTGIYSSGKDPMPLEARAAVYGVFFQMYNKNNYQEHYGSPAYGWKDTALLSAFIYAVLYCVWYIVNVKVLGLRFIGYKFWQDIPLYFAFYAIWAIVRAIKIECIERSDTIQPKIDLFNKVLGQKGFDMLILTCCAITLAFSKTYYRFDFIPLASVLMTAIGINLSLKQNSKPWPTENPYASDEGEESEEQLENPRGDIQRDYSWELDSPTHKDVKGQLTLYFDAQYISDLRFMNPFFNQRKDKPTAALIKDMFQYIKSHKSVSARTRYVVNRIEEISRQQGLAEDDTLQFMLDFVQEPNIRFVQNRDSDAIHKFEAYIRYPDEVLYDKEADSNSKAFLAAMLVHYMRRNVLFLYSRLQHHGAIGVEVSPDLVNDGRIFGAPIDEVTFIYNGKTYIFCETTADGFRIGGSLGGMKPEDFDERVEIPVVEKDTEDSNEETLSRLYNWDLDSHVGNKLHGTYTLEFNRDEIDSLRTDNPFLTYGMDSNSYADNVKAMFAYLENNPEKNYKVAEVASYIKSIINEKGYDDLDLVQFALDFCQEPNITYNIDELSAGINYAKEYMRFPEEVLFDKEGDCDCKSSLTIALFKELGFKTAFLMSEKHGHAAVGVEYNPEWKDKIGIEEETKVIRESNGVKYIYCETTADNNKVGQIKDTHSIQDFEIVEV